MKCSEFLKELTDYLDGTLDATTRAELDEHLHWCRNCFVICDTTRMTIAIYRENQVYELPDDLRSRLHTAIMARCQSGPKSSSDS